MIEAKPNVPDTLVQVIGKLDQWRRDIAADNATRAFRAEDDARAVSILDQIEKTPVLRIDVEEQAIVDRERGCGLRASTGELQNCVRAVGVRIDRM